MKKKLYVYCFRESNSRAQNNMITTTAAMDFNFLMTLTAVKNNVNIRLYN